MCWLVLGGIIYVARAKISIQPRYRHVQIDEITLEISEIFLAPTAGPTRSLGSPIRRQCRKQRMVSYETSHTCKLEQVSVTFIIRVSVISSHISRRRKVVVKFRPAMNLRTGNTL